jgi:hypothetical protein
MDDPDRIPVAEDAPAISVEVEAVDAPTVGGRMSLDYASSKGRQIEVTWLAHDPNGAWIVTAVIPVRGTSRVHVYLENPGRPDLK